MALLEARRSATRRSATSWAQTKTYEEIRNELERAEGGKGECEKSRRLEQGQRRGKGSSWRASQMHETQSSLHAKAAYDELVRASDSALELSLNHRETHNIELSDGTIWPMPTCLDVSEEQTLDIEKSELNGVRQLVLRDAEHNLLAVMDVDDV